MALFHDATVTPTKAEMIARWLPSRPWSPNGDGDVEVIGAYRFDDPEGRVGMETHLVTSGDTLVQVPLTYRDAPLEGADAAFIGEMEHTALGTRWVYDGLGDHRYLTMLAAVAMTGQGEALGLVEYEGRWWIAPTRIRIKGGGWTRRRVPLDRFEPTSGDDRSPVFRNDGFELTVHRFPEPGDQPAMGLTATWPEQIAPVVLAEVRQLT